MRLKRLISAFIACAMLFTMVPSYALADDSSIPITDIAPATSAKDVEVYVPDTTACTMAEGCTAEVHQDGCPTAQPAVNEPQEEQTPCTKTEGCTLTEGHEGDCEVHEDESEQEDREVPANEPVMLDLDIPEETCTVDYSKQQSEGVTYDGYEKDGDVYKFYYTISEGAGDELVIDLSQCALAMWENESQMPGVHYKFQILIQNNSQNTYKYKENSFVLAPGDTGELGNLEDGSLLPILTYDGQYMPIRFSGAMLPYYFYEDVFQVDDDTDVTFEMMCQIYDRLKEKGYEGESAITDYMLDYYNTKRGVYYESLLDLFADHPDWLEGNLVTNNGIWTMSEEELLDYIAKYPWIDRFVYVTGGGNNLSVQIKWPEPELAAVSYNSFYCGLFSVVYGQANVENLNPNGSGVEFSRAHGVGDYLDGTELYKETNEYFSSLASQEKPFAPDETLEVWSGYGLDGPGMGNVYQNYEFTYYNTIELENVGHKVQYYFEGHYPEEAELPETANYQTGATVEVADAPAEVEDWKFLGWTVWDTIEVSEEGTFEMPDRDVAIVGRWEFVGEETSTDWDVSKSKTATNLDENYESQITLSLPAAEYERTMDVVFVIDDTHTGSGIFLESVNALLDELAAKTTMDIRVGIVAFDAVARDWLDATSQGEYSGLVSLKDENALAALKTAAATQLDYDKDGYMRKVGATNTEWPVELAHQMLQDGNGEEKYLIMFSDFYGYVYRGALEVGGETYTDVPVSKRTSGWTQGSLSMATKYDTFAEAYAHKNDAENQTPDGFFRDSSWDNYWTIYQGINPAPVNDIADSYQVAWGTFSGFEKSLCMTFDALKEAAADTQVILVHNSYPFDDGENVQPMAEEMLDRLDAYDSVKLYRYNDASAEEIVQGAFGKIREDLIYLISAGSEVVDVIGSGSDYNFDFVDEVSALSMKVGDEVLTAEKIADDPQFTDMNATSIYGFSREGELDNYPFVLLYYANGQDGKSDECFVWQINEDVSKFAPAQLTYTVKLTNPKTEPGTYGEYDADGSQNKDSLYTNNSATLYPVDSNGDHGTPENFAKPTVSYTVEDPTITVTFKPGAHGDLRGAAAGADISYDGIKKGTGLGEDQAVPRVDEDKDWDFTNWLCTEGPAGMKDQTYTAAQIAELEFDVDTVFVAQYEEESSGGGAHHPEYDPDDDNDRDDDDEEEIIDEEVPLAETPWLNTVDHYAYIVGYPEDYVTGQPTEDESRWPVKPQANISRAEVATIFFRLLTDEARDQFWMTTNNFPDVAPDAWYNNAISTMVNAGIIQGYEDGTFRPNNNITRAEFAAIASRFMSSGYDVEEDLFTDIANHWARENINDAAMTQWIHGYPDGTFLPDQAITRAEAVTLVNNVLQRKPHADHMLDTMIKWPDNPESAWYYEAIQEATNSHDYDLFEDAEYETWTALQENRDWAALEKDWVNAHRTGGEVM